MNEEFLRKLGLSIARGVPQMATGMVDLAALPFTLTGLIDEKDVVGGTEYLTQRGLLPPPQEGLLNETTELVSSALNPTGAVKGGLLGLGALGTMVSGKAAKGSRHSPEQLAKFAAEKEKRYQQALQDRKNEEALNKRLKQKRLDELGSVGSSKFFTPEEIENQKFYIESGDFAGAKNEGKLNVVNVLERYFKKNNIPIEKVSLSNNDHSKSIYVNINGRTVRISDHYLPETPERVHNREQGLLGKWDDEIIISGSHQNLDDILKQITTTE